MGADYLIEVGRFPSSPGGTGSIEFSLGGFVGGCTNPSNGPNLVIGEITDIDYRNTEPGTLLFEMNNCVPGSVLIRSRLGWTP